MHTLNLGILAHVDAGKTSLTERLLYAAGAIDEIGSVDAGNTQTDSLALERQRGITIKSAVASFIVGDVVINLIDTPGHPDFIAEVERVLNVLDGAVLVISGVDGVQAQTRVLMRTLQRLHIPTVIFVNKLDRRGADHRRVVNEVADRLTPAIILMGSVGAEGTGDVACTPNGATDATFVAELAELLADRDEALLAAYVEDAMTAGYNELRGELADQTRRALVHPVFCGSAITGAGVEILIDGVVELLPPARRRPRPGDVWHRVQGRTRSCRRADRLRSCVLWNRADPGSSVDRRQRTQGHGDQHLRSRFLASMRLDHRRTDRPDLGPRRRPHR